MTPLCVLACMKEKLLSVLSVSQTMPTCPTCLDVRPAKNTRSPLVTWLRFTFFPCKYWEPEDELSVYPNLANTKPVKPEQSNLDGPLPPDL